LVAALAANGTQQTNAAVHAMTRSSLFFIDCTQAGGARVRFLA
jgi:hypothetical protein